MLWRGRSIAEGYGADVPTGEWIQDTALVEPVAMKEHLTEPHRPDFRIRAIGTLPCPKKPKGAAP